MDSGSWKQNAGGVADALAPFEEASSLAGKKEGAEEGVENKVVHELDSLANRVDSRTFAAAFGVIGRTCCGRADREFEAMLPKLVNWTEVYDIQAGMVDASARLQP